MYQFNDPIKQINFIWNELTREYITPSRITTSNSECSVTCLMMHLELYWGEMSSTVTSKSSFPPCVICTAVNPIQPCPAWFCQACELTECPSERFITWDCYHPHFRHHMWESNTQEGLTLLKRKPELAMKYLKNEKSYPIIKLLWLCSRTLFKFQAG